MVKVLGEKWFRLESHKKKWTLWRCRVPRRSPSPRFFQNNFRERKSATKFPRNPYWFAGGQYKYNSQQTRPEFPFGNSTSILIGSEDRR
jgi:hypothetical protein